jgi:hypothetical protein
MNFWVGTPSSLIKVHLHSHPCEDIKVKAAIFSRVFLIYDFRFVLLSRESYYHFISVFAAVGF